MRRLLEHKLATTAQNFRQLRLEFVCEKEYNKMSNYMHNGDILTGTATE